LIRGLFLYSKVLVGVLVLYWLQACNGPVKEVEKEAGEISITPDSLIWLSSYRNCAPDSPACTYMRITMPYVTDAWLRSTLESQLLSAKDGSNHISLDSACKSFVKEYEFFVAEMKGDYEIPWYQDQKLTLLFQEGTRYSFQLEHSEYTGGAHGGFFKQLFMVDVMQKRLFTAHDLLDTASTAFKQMLEFYFREAASIESDQSLAEAGYSFMDASFALPSGMCMVEEGLLCYYAVYEAGPYVMGDLEFVIPMDKVESFLKKPSGT
jgi:hypothetical protein